MWKFSLILVFSLAHIFVAVLSDKPMNSEVKTECPNAIKQFQRATLEYTPKLLKAIAVSNPRTTVLASATNLLQRIGLYANYAFGITYNEITKALGLNSRDEITCALKYLFKLLAMQSGLPEFFFQNLFVSENESNFTEQFMKRMKIINGRAIRTDFDNVDEAASMIDNALKRDTYGLVQYKISPLNIIKETTNYVTIGGFYQKALFGVSVDSSQIRPRNFFVRPNEQVKVLFYKLKDIMSYTDDVKLKCKVVDLPFKNKRFIIRLFMPWARFDINGLLKRLTDVDTYYSAVKNMKPCLVTMLLPYLNATTIFNTNSMFEKIDLVPSLRSPDKVKFKGIVNNSKPDYQSAAIQSASVIAAYEPSNQSEKIKPEIPNITFEKECNIDFNSPFVFYVVHEDGTALYGGVYANNNNDEVYFAK